MTISPFPEQQQAVHEQLRQAVEALPCFTEETNWHFGQLYVTKIAEETTSCYTPGLVAFGETQASYTLGETNTIFRIELENVIQTQRAFCSVIISGGKVQLLSGPHCERFVPYTLYGSL